VFSVQCSGSQGFGKEIQLKTLQPRQRDLRFAPTSSAGNALAFSVQEMDVDPAMAMAGNIEHRIGLMAGNEEPLRRAVIRPAGNPAER